MGTPLAEAPLDQDGPPAATWWWPAMLRGLSQRCPCCGKGLIYRRYLKVNEHCLQCGFELGEIRADDAPPYFTILVVGHIVIPSMLILEQLQHPPEWVHAAIWPALTVALALFLLPRLKGAVIALHWANNIRG